MNKIRFILNSSLDRNIFIYSLNLSIHAVLHFTSPEETIRQLGPMMESFYPPNIVTIVDNIFSFPYLR